MKKLRNNSRILRLQWKKEAFRIYLDQWYFSHGLLKKSRLSTSFGVQCLHILYINMLMGKEQWNYLSKIYQNVSVSNIKNYIIINRNNIQTNSRNVSEPQKRSKGIFSFLLNIMIRFCVCDTLQVIRKSF